jgi:hypothetical protein
MLRKLGLKLLLVALTLCCGSLYQQGCFESLVLGANPCGTVLAVCTPEQWLRAVFPLVTVPNYESDPSCSIPFRCGPYPPAGSAPVP